MTRKAIHPARKYLFPAVLAACAFALAGASCDKSGTVTPVDSDEVVRAIDNAEGKKPAAQNQGAAKPVAAATNAKPVEGVDVSGLDNAQAQRFYALADVLPSPCGKAHSLRTSIAEDKTCKRASFAARYVVAMIGDEAEDSDVKQFYNDRYTKAATPRVFALDGVPHSGPPDAPVKVVEFYDYGCPSCAQFAPILKEAMSRFPDQAVVFYKQYPLPGHQYSKPAAQAALAAAKQGKFEEMHAMLFAKAPYHRKPELLGYAKTLGLDLTQFEADYTAAQARVEADMNEGSAAGVSSTPTTFINGRVYEGPFHPKYIGMWIEEELAVNR